MRDDPLHSCLQEKALQTKCMQLEAVLPGMCSSKALQLYSSSIRTVDPLLMKRAVRREYEAL